MFSPNIEDFVYITDNAYTSSQIREMETLILKELKFELGRPLPLHFLRRASKAGEVSAAVSVGKLACAQSHPKTSKRKLLERERASGASLKVFSKGGSPVG